MIGQFGTTLVPSDWYDGHDKLFGPFKQRIVSNAKGTCFACGGVIDGEPAKERLRGGTTWLLHLACPQQAVKRKR